MFFATKAEGLTPSYYYKFYPCLQKHFRSQNASLIISRLEYWFNKPQFYDGFFKFLEPCSHHLYRDGDSWCEEVGIARKCFNKAFDLFGVRYKSKSDYLKAQSLEDPFQGKLYISYYDRKNNQLFYRRNHKITSTFFESLIKAGFTNKSKFQDIVKSNKLEKINPKLTKQKVIIHKEINCKKGRSQNSQIIHSLNNIDKQINTNISSNTDFTVESSQSLEIKIGEEMKKIWMEEVGHCNISTISLNLAKRMVQFLSTTMGNCLEKWRSYCKKITTSKFLMGEIKSSFKAWLTWAIQTSAYEKIQNGEYMLGDRIFELSRAGGIQNQQDFDDLAEQHIDSLISQQEKAVHRYLLSQKGAMKYYLYLKDIKLINSDPNEQSKTLVILNAQEFDFIKSMYETVISNAVLYYYPNIRVVNLVKESL